MAKKTYVLDTNVLIQDPESIFKFEDNDVVLADVTIEELDRLKKSPGEVGYCARRASRNIENLRVKGDIIEGISLGKNHGNFRVEVNHIHEEMPTNWDASKADNNIIRVAKGLAHDKENVILVSKDLLVRIKASIVGVKVEDYENEIVDDEVLRYDGRTQIYVSARDLAVFYKEGELAYDGGLVENEFVMMINEVNTKNTGIGRYTNGKIVRLAHEEEHPFKIIPRNVGQRYAIEALLAPADIAPLVILKGPAGTAKTFLSMACALEEGFEHHAYRKITLTRANVSFDAELGFLPGSESEKVNPLVRGCMDNLELLVDHYESSHTMALTKYQEIMDSGLIDIQALGYLRGRSISNQYLIIDEAQNTSPNQMLGILTRAGEGTKIVICGDLDQIDNTKLDKHTNGLAYAIEKMKGSPLCWVVGFSKDECTRSALAMEASSRMVDGQEEL